ncbi:response regulator transcription factor [Azoarcus sp. L1K30]|uniref:response regulator transcription factor n=1 Tax=Azoarcus sp. L1K30 TaxID=2820277 RepID=UPI001B81D749|nr:response regulator transcription factor [Azoarcus sp. L1K30]MBR0567706.1 response regulator transcription factor [Azoarcus sp. L1K30]
MTRHYFLTPEAHLLPRWQAAFADALPISVLPKADTADAVLWISTRLPEWRATLAQGGAGEHVRIVVISDSPTQAEGLEALEAGARGYCHALSTPAMLREVAVVVLHGGFWVGPELMARAIRATTARQSVIADMTDPVLERLTERERAVALAVARGLTNKEAAATLDITERTVKAHLSAIFEKLAVRDRMQLALKLSPYGELATS